MNKYIRRKLTAGDELQVMVRVRYYAWARELEAKNHMEKHQKNRPAKEGMTGENQLVKTTLEKVVEVEEVGPRVAVNVLDWMKTEFAGAVEEQTWVAENMYLMHVKVRNNMPKYARYQVSNGDGVDELREYLR